MMVNNKYPLILLSGTAANETIFQWQTEAFQKVIPVKWVALKSSDTMEDYADKLAASIAEELTARFGKDSPCYIAGFSLGGMLASLVAKRFNTKACILIASIRKPSEFPKRLRHILGFICRYTTWLVVTAVFLVKIFARCFMPFLACGASPKRKILLQQIFGCSSWFLTQQLRMIYVWILDPKTWREDFTKDVAEWCDFPVYHIHGANDRLLLCNKTKPDKIVLGRHLLPLFQADEVNRYLASVMAENDGEN
ncbi:MAG: alpha/beta hydrolase [Planctomycetaceae bacterium]|jgi:pimeloyl-ACP methyl ester carboxylesterase|nr:alpha/beta hydrolase [Planctomycetaceae bacterium]